jgi:DNA modification methylase
VKLDFKNTWFFTHLTKKFLTSNKIALGPLLDQIFNEDVLNLLKRIPDGSVDCVYADPDYNVGVKYNNVSYTKKFEDYISWCMSWSKESYRVLKDSGNFFIINYPKNNAHLRVSYLDNEFHDVNEYVWVYNTNIGHSKKKFTTAHRSILHCTKSKNNKFYKRNVAVPYKNPKDKRIKKLIANGQSGRMPYSWLYFNMVKNVGFSKTFHACQIPEDLSRTLIEATTKRGDVVLVLFGGSGSEIIECNKLGRHFISAEIDKKYHNLIKDRLRLGGAVPEKDRLLNRMKT